uniref:SIMPL domain-containing protein n=1 Tax=Acinetobacter baumannii TaxID=470 RepID=UPI0013D48E95
ELMFVDFAGCCLDQILNQAAKFRYMFGGKAVTPLVIRTMVGAGLRAAAMRDAAAQAAGLAGAAGVKLGRVVSIESPPREERGA